MNKSMTKRRFAYALACLTVVLLSLFVPTLAQANSAESFEVKAVNTHDASIQATKGLFLGNDTHNAPGRDGADDGSAPGELTGCAAYPSRDLTKKESRVLAGGDLIDCIANDIQDDIDGTSLPLSSDTNKMLSKLRSFTAEDDADNLENAINLLGEFSTTARQNDGIDRAIEMYGDGVIPGLVEDSLAADMISYVSESGHFFPAIVADNADKTLEAINIQLSAVLGAPALLRAIGFADFEKTILEEYRDDNIEIDNETIQDYVRSVSFQYGGSVLSAYDFQTPILDGLHHWRDMLYNEPLEEVPSTFSPERMKFSVESSFCGDFEGHRAFVVNVRVENDNPTRAQFFVHHVFSNGNPGSTSTSFGGMMTYFQVIDLEEDSELTQLKYDVRDKFEDPSYYTYLDLPANSCNE